MDIKLIVNKVDLDKISNILRIQENNDLFVDTVSSNVKSSSINPSNEDFWGAIVGCLLSSRQNSSPDSPIAKFMDQKPFPPCLEKCKRNDLE
jgi:hypothetical protein